MHVTILGANGFIGRTLSQRLTRDGTVGDTALASLTLFDIDPPEPLPAGFPVHCHAGDVADLAAFAAGTGVVFHLAAAVSSAAEADYELGRRVNLDGVRAVIDACRKLETPPRVVFTSSVAGFSGGQGAVLGDDARQCPATSYGTQKAIGELLLADASRRGFLDGVSLRLPTVIVRPGRPNAAASSFASAILREPLQGLAADLPVPDDFVLWVCSPGQAVDWLLHAATMDTAALADRSINPPGLRVTVGAMLAALEQQRPGAAAHIRRRPDPAVAAIVAGWPAAFQPERGIALGFAPQSDIAAILAAFIAEEMAPAGHERAR